MSMSTYVVGFNKPDDGNFQKYKAVWDACNKAGVDIPEDVCNYFGGDEPDDSGMQVDISDAVTEYSENMVEGYEVDITKLPKGVSVIRFFNSY